MFLFFLHPRYSHSCSFTFDSVFLLCSKVLQCILLIHGFEIYYKTPFLKIDTGSYFLYADFLAYKKKKEIEKKKTEKKRNTLRNRGRRERRKRKKRIISYHLLNMYRCITFQQCRQTLASLSLIFTKNL